MSRIGFASGVGVIVAMVVAALISWHREPPIHRGDVGERCLPNGTCNGTALYCRRVVMVYGSSFECWVKEER